MARAAEAVLGERLIRGLVVTKDGHGGELRACELLETGHPVPDERSAAAGRRWLEIAGRGPARHVLLVLLSGGASALLTCPVPGLRLTDLANATDALLRAGASIEELNAVRKHLTALGGGRLAEVSNASQIELLALSDVPEDRFDIIGSGPVSPDPTRFADAWTVAERYGRVRTLPEPVVEYLERGLRGDVRETPKPGAARFADVAATLVGSLEEALSAAEREARARGFATLRHRPRLRGEARNVGRRLAALARCSRPRGPMCWLGGGETTVTVSGPGRGGRCQELALAAALEGAGQTGFALLAAGSDGSDGPTPAAGAWVDETTVARGRRIGCDARESLARNDSYGFFRQTGNLVETGPTGTNVTDLVLLAMGPSLHRPPAPGKPFVAR